MHERQPDSEDTFPHLPFAAGPEQPLTSPESLTKTQLAEQIIADYGTPYTDPNSGAVAQRDSWVNRSQMHSFHLLAFTVNGTPRYLLDVHHVGVDEKRRYAFGEDQTIIYYYPNSNVECLIPKQSVLHESLMGYLRMRYSDTQHYSNLKQRFDTVFYDSMSRFLAEYALDFTTEFETGEQHIPELYASDAATRERARKRLFKIASQSGIICAKEPALREDAFQLALDQTLQERYARQQTPTDDPGKAKTTNTIVLKPQKPWHRFLSGNTDEHE